MNDILARERAEHPQMQDIDAVKLLYQSEFGCGHLVTDEVSSLSRIAEEWGDGEDPLADDIGGGYARLNLRGAARAGISQETVNRAFIASAKDNHGTDAGFAQKLAAYGLKSGGEQPRHSLTYRAAYAPAYRVVKAAYLPILPAIDAIERRGKMPLVMAIDGRCGAGKTTLARMLCEIYGASVIYMDDFFLPIELRTAERFSRPGGNVHYERFIEEVLPNLHSGCDFTYRIFDCSSMDYGGVREVPAAQLMIIEGSYSMREDLRGAYDLSVFCDIAPDMQKRRIIAREGLSAWPDFEQKYIPLEERYIAQCRAKEACEVIING